MRALVTGATGFIGRSLVRRLDEAVVLSRQAGQARHEFPGARVYDWDPMSGPPPAKAFEGVEAVFHLAGESVGEGRWTAAKKQRILASRTVGTQNLVSGIEQAATRPAVLVSASAVGYYGSRGEELLDEAATPGNDFLAEVCVAWEAAAHAARRLGVRVVTPRTSLVLGRSGGALPRMLLPFRLGLGGRLASGRQWMPWIHVEDEVGLLLHAARCPAIAGPLNAAAPEAVTNREFTRVLARVLRRPALFPAPALALRVMLGEFADVLLASQRVVPRVAQETGYTFQYPGLEGALREILGGGASR